jgi:hypothetical protein
MDSASNNPPQLVRGSDLSAALQAQCTTHFAERFTREHTPEWATKTFRDGRTYPLHFDSDADWLANSYFTITAAGELDTAFGSRSTPTWPDSPQLRAQAA